MKLKVESTTLEREYIVKDISELQEKLKLAMKSMDCKKCVFQLNGEADLRTVEELYCLFG